MQGLVSSGALFGLDEDQWGLFEGKQGLVGAG